jgi:uncharacterized cupredoxin-like copper-binding protein
MNANMRSLSIGLVLTITPLAALGPARAATTHTSVPAAAKAVRVIAGKPSELSFTLSSHTVRLGTVVFTIKNSGAIVHDFKVCTTSRTKPTANTCNGRSSRKLTHGQSVKLTVKFKKKGSYEYLCTIPGHAAAGMKGILKVA